MASQGTSGIKRILLAFNYSIQGLRAAFKNEAAFRQELICCAVLIPLAIYLANSNLERALLISSLLLVLIIELGNSAIEAIVDRISEEQHVLSGRAKDIGSAAVLLALLNVLLVWGLVLC